MQACVDHISRMAAKYGYVVLVKTTMEFIGKQNVEQFGVIVRQKRDKVRWATKMRETLLIEFLITSLV